jgi:hypothetical protein
MECQSNACNRMFSHSASIFGHHTQSLIHLFLAAISRNVNNYTFLFLGECLFYPQTCVLNYLRSTSDETVMIQCVCHSKERHFFQRNVKANYFTLCDLCSTQCLGVVYVV